MKNTIIALLLVCSALPALSATSITTPTVSGHWTLAGSPYKIYNDITIPSGQTLTIDPGVEVVFQGLYSFFVTGSLAATGTAAQNIKFRAQDTTGWYDDNVASGGWRGIRFEDTTSGIPDVSSFSYCTVTDIKYGGTPGGSTSVYSSFEVYIRRRLRISNCNFNHNLSENGGGTLLNLAGMVTIENSVFYNNKANMRIFLFFALNNQRMSNCNIYNNTCVGDIVNVLMHESITSPLSVTIEGCNLYQNASTGEISKGAIVSKWGNNPVVLFNFRKNKVHHNTQSNEAAVQMVGGYADINGNLICNNHHIMPGTCGPAEGGGGIRLHSNLGFTNYIVRNNIIANNHSEFWGGGIYVWQSNARIYNNTIVNNTVPNTSFPQGAGICLIQDTFRTYIKNNLLYNNLAVGTTSSPNIYSHNNSPIIIEHNWLQRPLSADLLSYAGYTLYYGDTMSNVVATSPGMVAPTLTASLTENAVPANFSLLQTSACINTGDTTSALPYSTDYNNVSRIAGTSIDIGACEFNSFCPDPVTGGTDICVGGTTTLSHPVAGGTWSSPNAPALVTVDATTGLVTGVAGYNAAIYYHTGTCMASTNVHIHALPSTVVGPSNVCMGSAIALFSLPSGGTWTASNPTATISATGIVTPVSFGLDTFYYNFTNMCGTTTLSATVQIDTLPGAITGPHAVCEGLSATLSCSGSGYWISPEFGPSFINTTTGEYTGSPVGRWSIVYQLPTGCRSYTQVTVNPNPIISGAVGNVCIGTPKPLTANISGGSWSSSDMSIISVAATGIASGITSGTAIITYTSPIGCTQTVTLTATVCPTAVETLPPPATISVYPNPATDRIAVTTPVSAGTLELRNVTGIKVAEQPVTGTTTGIDVHKLPRGIYMLLWQHDDARIVQRVVVQ